MKKRSKLVLLALVGFTAPASAQDASAPPVPVVSSPIEIEGTFALYPQDADRLAEAEDAETWNSFGTDDVVRNVTVPSITPFLPEPEKATGAAVIIAPGGGFMLLSIENEGINVARWFADHGIAAFLLKYRVQPTPPGVAEFARAGAERMGNAAERSEPPEPYAPAVEDGIAAVRHIREHADQWDIDADRIGMIGFSAGAMTTLAVTTTAQDTATPDFIGLIYGPMAKIEANVDLPPLFAAIAADDRLFAQGNFGIFNSWREAGSPAELHVYQQGGHGFGMLDNGTTTMLWPEEFIAWMKTNDFLEGSIR